MRIRSSSTVAFLVAIALIGCVAPSRAPAQNISPDYEEDTGGGIPTSLFGTYVRGKELIFYPFYEYTRTNHFEYEPREVGVPSSQEFKNGKLVQQEALIFLAYGFNDSLALEFESAVGSWATFTRDPADSTGTPNQIKESGLGDTEINLRWRPLKQTETRPDVTFFFQTVFPFQKGKYLIGTQDWEFAGGAVLTKRFAPLGTFALRGSFAYDRGQNSVEFDEWAIDYIKRLNPKWRLVLSVEGSQVDEVAFITEAQYALGKHAVMKLNCGFGLNQKAPVVAPEIGVLFVF